MSVVDLWGITTPTENKPQKKKEVKQKKRAKPTKYDLSSLYVVTAGVNRATERQLFLSTFEDCDEWSISVVPSVMSKSRALKMMEKAQQFINDNPKKYRNKVPTLTLESLENADIYKQARYVLK